MTRTSSSIFLTPQFPCVNECSYAITAHNIHYVSYKLPNCGQTFTRFIVYNVKSINLVDSVPKCSSKWPPYNVFVTQVSIRSITALIHVPSFSLFPPPMLFVNTIKPTLTRHLGIKFIIYERSICPGLNNTTRLCTLKEIEIKENPVKWSYCLAIFYVCYKLCDLLAVHLLYTIMGSTIAKYYNAAWDNGKLKEVKIEEKCSQFFLALFASLCR